ncbi:uncharacterized protein LOC124811383 isoform X1 [Hydra vulgaris]|uniref:uncharacterized protein LOC124811383 isoform X1 n=1 Tax=Hydra vulgaris TaxID=6087 RepID=UPI001F5EC630|nr:uncharacterized protein LOC124811383 [Hydra vulgaris]
MVHLQTERLYLSMLGNHKKILKMVLFTGLGMSVVLEYRKIFFICDVPHLMKTMRNNLEKSHENSSSRNLMIDGQMLVWNQIISFYDWDIGIDRDAVGLIWDTS